MAVGIKMKRFFEAVLQRSLKFRSHNFRQDPVGPPPTSPSPPVEEAPANLSPVRRLFEMIITSGAHLRIFFSIVL